MFRSSRISRRISAPVMQLAVTSTSKCGVQGVHTIATVDALPYNKPNLVATYLLSSTPSANHSTTKPALAVVETNTSRAVPYMETAIRDAGFTLDHVKFIIVTHVHLDHAAGAGTLLARCPNATVICDPRAKRHLVDPSRLLASARKVYQDEAEFANEVGDMIPCPEDRIRAMDDGDSIELFPGRELRFLHVEGHARHHFAVHDQLMSSCFTGDAFGVNSYHTIKDAGVRPGTYFPTTSPTDFDVKEAIRSIERIAALPIRYVFPTHFGGCDAVAEGREQLLRILPLMDALRAEALIMLRFGVKRASVESFVRSGVRFLLKQHLLSRGLQTSVAQQLFSSTGEFRNDITVNAMGLVHAAAVELASQRTSTNDSVTAMLKAASTDDLQRMFPFVSDVTRITEKSSLGHVLACLAREANRDDSLIEHVAQNELHGGKFLAAVKAGKLRWNGAPFEPSKL